jgi:hypothetical protein
MEEEYSFLNQMSVVCSKTGGITCPKPAVYLTNQQTSYNNPQISQKMKYAQYVRTQLNTYGSPKQ